MLLDAKKAEPLQSLLAAAVVDFALQLAIQIVNYPHVWFGDFRVWTTAATIVSLLVIAAVQWVEHDRLRNANGVVLFYWLFLLIVLAVKLRSLVSQQIYASNLAYFITYTTGVGLALVEFLVEWLWPRSQSSYEALVDEEECPAEYATVFSLLTFSWMTPLMKYGYKQFLTEDDLWGLVAKDRTNSTGKAFEESWQFELKHRKHPSLWLAVLRAYGGPYALAAFFKVGNDVSAFTQPQLLRMLIAFADSYSPGNEPEPVIKGAAIALAMFAVGVFQTAMIHQYFQLSFVSGMRIKSGLASAIYRKSLKLSNEGRSAKSTGDIVNYMAVDAQRLQDLTQFAQQLWSAPFQIFICMYSLYNLVGWSMLAGIGVMIIMIPINGFIARIMKNLQKQQMKNKDARSRLIAEIINNMKSIKLYAWGAAFMNKLNYIRNDLELKNLRRIGAGQAIANFTWSTTPFLVSCLTFTVFVLTGDAPLTTEIVFPALGRNRTPCLPLRDNLVVVLTYVSPRSLVQSAHLSARHPAHGHHLHHRSQRGRRPPDRLSRGRGDTGRCRHCPARCGRDGRRDGRHPRRDLFLEPPREQGRAQEHQLLRQQGRAVLHCRQGRCRQVVLPSVRSRRPVEGQRRSRGRRLGGLRGPASLDHERDRQGEHHLRPPL